MKNNVNVVYAIVNRNGKTLFLNSNTNQYKVIDGGNSAHDTNKVSLKVICKLLDKVADSDDMNKVATIVLPKNLAFVLRKESVYNWLNNGNKTANGYELDEEFIGLCKYISDMRNYLGYRVKFKMTGTPIVNVNEESAMKKAWNLLDKETGYNQVRRANVMSRPSKPAFMSK